MMHNKLCTAEEAAALVKDGDVLLPCGFIRSMAPELLINALEERFLETGHPRDLTLIHSASASEHHVGGNAGINRLAHDGLVKLAFSGFYGHNDKYKEMIKEGKIEAYNFPLGLMSQLFRAYANGEDGVLSKYGLKTYVDPRIEGAKWNHDIPSSGEYIKVVNFMGREMLWYTTPKPTVAFLRGTSADEYGNITLEDEALFSHVRASAMAVKQNGGTVIVQVKNYVKAGTLDSQAVVIPGIFVDKIVICREVEKYHRQTSGAINNSVYSGHLKQTESAIVRMPLDARKIMARRSAVELMPGAIVNLGTGNPEFVSNVAAEEGCLDEMTLTVEAGAIGGSPLPGDDFGAAANAWAYLDEDRMFDLYHGGGLDICFLGLAEANAAGDVNVSKFKGTIMGCGGFIEITQSTHKVVFLGTFTAGGLKVKCEDGKLVIVNEGKHVKFKKDIEQITFSSEYANENGQEVLFVTERAVFRLTPEGLELTEIAPGIDLEKDVLGHMEFRPIINDVKLMDERYFREENMGLEELIQKNAGWKKHC